MNLAGEVFSSGEPQFGSRGTGGEPGRSVGCDAVLEKARADELYFTGRMLASVARARASADSLARLAHYELAGRYSVAALTASRQRSLGRCRQ